MRPILPVLRERKRYMVFEVINSQNFEETVDAINNSFKQLFGELGMAEAGLVVMKNFKNNRGILRMNHKAVDRVKMALAMIKNIGKSRAIVKSISVSGSLNKVRLRLKNELKG